MAYKHMAKRQKRWQREMAEEEEAVESERQEEEQDEAEDKEEEAAQEEEGENEEEERTPKQTSKQTTSSQRRQASATTITETKQTKQKKTKKKKQKQIQAQPQNQSQAAEGDPRCTVYISGISYDASEEDLRDLFAACGTMVDCRMPRYQDSGKIRGYAHVDFDSAEAAEKACALSGQVFHGRYLDIAPAKPRHQKIASSAPPAFVPGCKSIFVKGVPYSYDEEQLKRVFASCGQVTSIRLLLDNRSARFKGCGYLDFSSEKGVMQALKLHGTELEGRPILVSCEMGKPKAGFKFRTTEELRRKVAAKQSESSE